MVTPIEQAYIDLHPKSAEYYATSKDLFPNGVTHDARNLKPFPYFVTHAQGSRKWDVDGNEIVDYKGGHGALILGHNHPDIVAAVTEQMTKGTHYAASTEIEIEWAQLVRDLIPCSEKVRFHSSGTEATMMAVRMARAYTGRTKLLKFRDHFHGWNDYVRSHEPAAGGIPVETASTVISIEPNDIGLVERTLSAEADVAAVIVEPTGAHMGDTPLRPSFLGELREVTERYGVVLIFDEVVTGFRMSKGGAQGLYGVTPDMCTPGEDTRRRAAGRGGDGQGRYHRHDPAQGRARLQQQRTHRPQWHLQREPAVGGRRTEGPGAGEDAADQRQC